MALATTKNPRIVGIASQDVEIMYHGPAIFSFLRSTKLVYISVIYDWDSKAIANKIPPTRDYNMSIYVHL